MTSDTPQHQAHPSQEHEGPKTQADENQPGQQEVNEASRGPRLREIPLRLMIPNLITVLAICAGLTGVRLAFEGRFELAVGMVLVAAFLDGIDGRIARLMKATSKFGAQMDSLADIVNFGVAPGLVLYVYILDQARSFGWIAALIFAISAGLRLARFNVMDERAIKAPWQNAYFVGVPAPAGALLVMLPIYLGFLGVEATPGFAFASSAYTMLIAFLLISRLPVWSGKSEKKVRRDLVLPLTIAVVLYVALLMSFTWEVLSVTVIVYLLSLPFGARAWKRKYGTLTVMEDHDDHHGAGMDRGL
ncbi:MULTISPECIES: CDP-alcohol phosphatidyltransferase family protein [Rhizobium/Agrobacterium group]|uniref:Phosphatidylserine synthase n=2 Tax=Rhizobium/Agrobacterium group TaxID=227290 RepID=B9JUQ4_ALLAM|nr:MULTISPECIES: phosphatidylcholine/phosphatidylserine synthase [Rhizobium/Agrobacterium group]ACM36049.1 phosphatidylserine synthase [Allorhizobium ampelinum S4]MCF1449923.1 phosphatidylcholine/phosphatidylserine synthase [Allorhizobium ampelinum]MCF1492172.1 phosphatidylcholine/phosphatidylserine synthase [Allorhizobium ampelinum]MUO29687.1 CDP-diacylglycerol--serine O-phosphatidyltransferase [Agrobacterium vitis]MUO44000.1 CDP-diacylglycerol--serine O-phosphatidyltransferase [Agrobacterium